MKKLPLRKVELVAKFKLHQNYSLPFGGLMLGYRHGLLVAALFSCQVFASPLNVVTAQIADSTDQENCNNELAGSAAYFAKQAEIKRGSFAAKRPKFITLQEDKELAKNWRGEKGPALLQAFLPDGVKFVDHELKNNEASGVIKLMQQSGEFVVLRVEMEFEGEVLSTNVVISAFGLAENLKRRLAGEKIYLLGPSVASAIFWGHGGGTNTSNASTVDVLMNSLSKNNTGAFAWDHPMHGEGPRKVFKDAAQFFRFQVALRNKFIHPDVAVFKIGHSMGGLDADMAFRRTGRADIGLADAFRGYIPMSYVPDLAPGGTPEEHERAEAKQRALHESPAFKKFDVDGDLGRMLTRDGKVSIMCELQCLFLMRENDWSLGPNPNVTYRNSGRPIKALYVMGDFDRLNQGAEEVTQQRLLTLPNTTVKTMGVRVTRDGDLAPTGHIIYDNLLPVQKSKEADRVIRDWMTQQNPSDASLSQEELTEKFRDTFVRPYVSEYSFATPNNNLPSTLILAAYFYDDNFKTYLKNHIRSTADYSKVGSLDPDGDALTERDALHAARRKYFKQFGVKETYEAAEMIREFIAQTLAEDGRVFEQRWTPLPATPELKIFKFFASALIMREWLPTMYVHEDIAKPEWITMNKVIKKYQDQVKNINSSKKSEEEKRAAIANLALPVDEVGRQLSREEAEKLRALVMEIQGAKNLGKSKEKDDIDNEIKRITKDTSELAAKIKRWEGKLRYLISQNHPDEIAQSVSALAVQEDQLNKNRELVSGILTKRLTESTQRGLNFAAAVDELDQDMWNAAIFWHKEADQFGEAQSALDQAKLEAVKAGKYGPKAMELAHLLHGKGQALDQMKTLIQKMQLALQKVRNYNKAREDLKQATFAKPTLAQYFEYRSTSVWDLLADPEIVLDEERAKQLITALGKTISKFESEVWGNRPPPAGTKLY